MRQRRSNRPSKAGKQHYRGNRNTGNNKSNNGQYRGSRGPQSRAILPPPSVIQEYEYATEGAADRLFELAEKEQRQRHQWEDEYLAYYKKSLRIGQVFGALVLLSVVAGTTILALFGKQDAATMLAAGGFGSLILSNLLLSGQKRHPKRPRHNPKHNHYQEREKKKFEMNSNDNRISE